jgi:hypothetical protein
MKIEELKVEDLDKMGMNELIALRQWTLDPSENNWKLVTLGRLRDERDKLKRENIPETDWPVQFQGEDWEINVRKQMGLPPMTKEELEHYVSSPILVELRMQREILKTQGVDESLWPEKLQGSDWNRMDWRSHQ